MEESPEPRLDRTASTAWTWRRLLALAAVVILFAAGVLQFALLEWHHWPADQRVNDGSQPTFFAFNILPSFNFSEDFYLYYTRAKRIARRGWSDSLFYSRPNAGENRAAPVQVALSSMALKTDGRPVPYALFMFALLTVSWVALLVAARCWLPGSVSSESVLLAVLVTVLFESTHYFVCSPEFPTFGQWPMFRALRMSTMGWSSPLLVAVVLGTTSLAFDRRRWWATATAVFAMLLLLAGADNWAFGMAWFVTGIALAWIVANTAIERWRTGVWPTAARRVIVGLGLVVVATFLIHHQFSDALSGDMLLRGGFGPEWRNSIRSENNVLKVRDWFAQQGLFPVVVVLFGSLFALRPAIPSARVPLRLRWRRYDAPWAQFAFMALVPLVAMLTLYVVLKSRGMEPFLRHQFFWRANYCWLFAFAISVLEWWREGLTAWFGKSRREVDKSTAINASPSINENDGNRIRRILGWPARFAPKRWPAAVAVAIALLFAYHNYRIHWFVTNVAARDFFLTADAEKLRPWLEQFEREHGKFRLATASLELNYLAAYWTNADLLLPSGFPYHSAETNQEIRQRVVQLLRLYGATKESWREFTRSVPGRFQEMWRTSRVKSSGEAYLYHLYHRMLSFNTASLPRWRIAERAEIGKAICSTDEAHHQPVAMVSLPEVILVDDVSRALGQPDLSSYQLAFQSGSIEAWVRRGAAVAGIAQK